MKRACLLSILLLIAMTMAAYAQTTVTAASCQESAVNAVINGPTHTAVDGDTIVIPAGSCTWTSQLVVPSNIGITVTGAGAANSGAATFGPPALTTIITDNTGGNPLISASPEYGNSTMRISMLDIEPGASSDWSPIAVAGTCSSGGCPSIRIDNIGFGIKTQWTEGAGGSNDWMIRADNVFGVIDHCNLPSGSTVELFNASLSKYLGVGDYGDNSWAQPDTFGGAGNLFAENNIVYTNQAVNDCDVAAGGSSDSPGGCRIVLRYNQTTMYSNGQAAFAFSIVHGLDTDGRPQSGRQIEAYKNSISMPGSSGYQGVVGFRGGTGLQWGNTITKGTGASLNEIMSRSVYRTVYGNATFGYCGGMTSLDPFDKQDNTVYYTGTATSASGLTLTDTTKSWTTNQLAPAGNAYSIYDTTQGFVAIVVSNTSTTATVDTPISESSWTGFNSGDHYEIVRAPVCADQAGRGAGNYISGSTPSPSAPLNQALDPIYEWNDSVNGSTNYGVMSGTNPGNTVAFRDWYNANLNQTAQTTPSSPFSCNGSTGGVGFGTLANRPSSCSGACSLNSPGCGYFATDQGAQGTLYVWSSGAWATHYTPYTYPHPLTNGGTITTPNPPTNLKGAPQPN